MMGQGGWGDPVVLFVACFVLGAAFALARR